MSVTSNNTQSNTVRHFPKGSNDATSLIVSEDDDRKLAAVSSPVATARTTSTSMTNGKDRSIDNSISLVGNSCTTTELRPTDVVIGRGAAINGNPGNFAFRQVIRAHKAEYQAALLNEKDKIARAVILEIHLSNGRFLQTHHQRKESTLMGAPLVGPWNILSDDDAVVVEKVKQALREKESGWRVATAAEETTTPTRDQTGQEIPVTSPLTSTPAIMSQSFPATNSTTPRPDTIQQLLNGLVASASVSPNEHSTPPWLSDVTHGGVHSNWNVNGLPTLQPPTYSNPLLMQLVQNSILRSQLDPTQPTLTFPSAVNPGATWSALAPAVLPVASPPATTLAHLLPFSMTTAGATALPIRESPLGRMLASHTHPLGLPGLTWTGSTYPTSLQLPAPADQIAALMHERPSLAALVMKIVAASVAAPSRDRLNDYVSPQLGPSDDPFGINAHHFPSTELLPLLSESPAALNIGFQSQVSPPESTNGAALTLLAVDTSPPLPSAARRRRRKRRGLNREDDSPIKKRHR